MAVADEKSGSDGKVWSLCSIPFWQNGNASSSGSSSSTVIHSVHVQAHGNGHKPAEHSSSLPSVKVSSLAKSLLPTRRRLRLDPSTKLYFPCMCLRCLFACFFCLIATWVLVNLWIIHLGRRFSGSIMKFCCLFVLFSGCV